VLENSTWVVTGNLGLRCTIYTHWIESGLCQVVRGIHDATITKRISIATMATKTMEPALLALLLLPLKHFANRIKK